METPEAIPARRLPQIYLPKPGKPYQLAKLLYRGVPLEDACSALQVQTATGHQWQCRWRKRASRVVGRPVNTTGPLHCIFAPEKVLILETDMSDLLQQVSS